MIKKFSFLGIHTITEISGLCGIATHARCMRWIAAFPILLAMGCGKQDPPKSSETSAQPPAIEATDAAVDTSTHDSLNWPKLISPPFVVQAADDYLGSVQIPSNSLQSARDAFVRAFFWGYTRPESGPYTDKGTMERGFEAGAAYRREHPSQLKETMEAFGYILTEAKGTWLEGFEISWFESRAHPGERWWLSGLGGLDETVYDLPEGTEMTSTGISVKISGFLSPRGGYGHMNACDHEFLATKVTISSDGNKNSNGK